MSDNISVILNMPQLGVNIGAAARVMKNFALTDLRIVNPRDGWPNESALTMAASAKDIIENAKIYGSLLNSLENIDYLIAVTARSRDMKKDIIEIKNINKYLLENNIIGRIGLLFGSEKSGLSNEDVSFCNLIMTIDTNPEYGSLNLAQAVAICVYELVYKNNSNILAKVNQDYASQEDIIKFTEHLIKKLETANFFKSDHVQSTMKTNLRNIFTRCKININELRTLHGIFKTLNNTSLDE